ncbi:hypothetical protein IJJ97_04535, partial [bacterium]|nr:hypothetical protein [bacterium]
LNVQPVQTQPLNVQPVQTQPLNVQPVQTQPLNVQPVQKKSLVEKEEKLIKQVDIQTNDISKTLEDSKIKNDSSVDSIDFKNLQNYDFNGLFPVQFMINQKYIDVSDWNDFINKLITAFVLTSSETILSLTDKKISKNYATVYFVKNLPNNIKEGEYIKINDVCYFLIPKEPIEMIDSAISICRKLGINPVINFELLVKSRYLIEMENKKVNDVAKISISNDFSSENKNEISKEKINKRWIANEAESIENEIWKSLEILPKCNKYSYANLRRAKSSDKLVKLGINIRYVEIESDIFYVESYFDILFQVYDYSAKKYADKFERFASQSMDFYNKNSDDYDGYNGNNNNLELRELTGGYLLRVNHSLGLENLILKINNVCSKMGIYPNEIFNFYMTTKESEENVRNKALLLAKKKAEGIVKQEEEIEKEKEILSNLQEINQDNLTSDVLPTMKPLDELPNQIEISPNASLISKEISTNISNLVVPSSSINSEVPAKLASQAFEPFSPIRLDKNVKTNKKEDVISQEYKPIQPHKPVTEFKTSAFNKDNIELT